MIVTDTSGPRPGFFRVRFVKGGPWVGARIWWETECIDPLTGAEMERPRILLAEIDDAPCEPEYVQLHGFAIPEAEWSYLAHTARWAVQYAPDDPAANPRRAIDLNALPPIY